jgi:hypothetical protein
MIAPAYHQGASIAANIGLAIRRAADREPFFVSGTIKSSPLFTTVVHEIAIAIAGVDIVFGNAADIVETVSPCCVSLKP